MNTDPNTDPQDGGFGDVSFLSNLSERDAKLEQDLADGTKTCSIDNPECTNCGS